MPRSARRHPLASILLLAIVAALGATACGTSSSAAGQPSGPTLHVTLVQSSGQTLLDKEVRDGTAVQQLHDAAPALPLVTPGTYHCNETGRVYHLEYSGVQGPVTTMQFDTGSCPFIQFPQVNENHRMDQAFISLFMKTIGVSKLDPAAP